MEEERWKLPIMTTATSDSSEGERQQQKPLAAATGFGSWEKETDKAQAKTKKRKSSSRPPSSPCYDLGEVGSGDTGGGGGRRSDDAIEGVLKDVLLSRLPVRSVFRMRAVSKVFGDRPLQLDAQSCIPALQQESWLLLLQVPGFPSPKQPFSWRLQAFSDVERKYFTLPALTGPWLKYLIGRTMRFARVPCISAASNGFLCAYVRSYPIHRRRPRLSDLDSHSSKLQQQRLPRTPTLLVFNCLTGSSKLLHPPPLHHAEQPIWREDQIIWMDDKILMSAAHNINNDSSSAYYILLLRPPREYFAVLDFHSWSPDWSFHLYDSSHHQWKVPQPPSSARTDSVSLLACDFFTFFPSRTYMLLESSVLRPGRQAHILGYRASHDKWYEATLSQKDIRTHFLAPYQCTEFARHDGRLLMLVVRDLGDPSPWKEAHMQVLEVFPVSHDRCTLRVISNMPGHLWHQNAYPLVTKGANLFCVSFIPASKYKPNPNHRHSPAPVIYDIPSNHWYCLPRIDDGCCYPCVAVVEPRKAMSLPKLGSRLANLNSEF